MKQQAHAILKHAIADHREMLLRDRLSCLGTLRDFGGRDHPEIYLLADAVEERIFDRLMVSQPVTANTIDSISRDLAQSRSIKLEDARFAVESWADALSLFYLDPSKYADEGDNVSYHQSEQQHWSDGDTTNEPQTQWYYYEGNARIGPTSETSIQSLIRSGKIKHSTLVWRNGMSRWEPADENFADAFSSSVSSLPSATTFKIKCPNCAQPIEAPLHYLNTSVVCPNCSTAFTAGQNQRDHAATSAPSSTVKHYGGIRRVKFIAITFGMGLLIGFFEVIAGNTNSTGKGLLNLVLIVPIYFRLQNIGTNPWWCLISWIPIVNLYTSFLTLFCQEGYWETKTLDKAGKTALWIVLGIIGLVVIAAISIANIK